MGSLTTFEKDAILDSFGGGGYFLACYTTATGDDGSGTEVAGGTYARQEILLDPASAGATQNTDPLSFPGMPACTVVDVAILDDVSAGNMILHNPLPAPVPVLAGQSLDFAAGAVSLTAD